MSEGMFGVNTVSRVRVLEWHTWFSEDREEVEDDKRLGRLVTTRTVEKVPENKWICAGRPMTEHSACHGEQ